MINIRQNKGFALIFSMIFLFLIVFFVAVYTMATANALIIANRTANGIKAYYIAEAGLSDAYERILQFSPLSTNPYISSATAGTDNGQYTLGNGSQGTYTVSIVATHQPISYSITSTGTFNNVQKTLQLNILGAAISKYAYWAQVEGNASWWITGQTVFGPVHSNGSLEIYGNPVFDYGLVEESAAAPTYYSNTNNKNDPAYSNPAQIWQDGLQNNSPQVLLPAKQTLTAIDTAATSSGLVLTGNSTVIFNPNGTLTVTGKVVNPSNCNTVTTYNNTTIAAPTAPANCPYPKDSHGNPINCGVIYVQSSNTLTNVVNGVTHFLCSSPSSDGNVTVQGTVNGEITVAADQNIYVSGNISYNDPPTRFGIAGGDPNSTDLVGLVASQNITINTTAPKSLELDGVLVAIQGSVQAANANIIEGDMDQFGSLINNVLGILGYFDPSTGLLTGGWNQLQSYDFRLLNIAPPGFPSAYTVKNGQQIQVYTKQSLKEL